MINSNNNLEEFLSSLTDERYQKSMSWYASQIQDVCDFDSVMEMDLDNLENLLGKLRLTNVRTVSYFLNVLRRYAEFIGNQRFVEMSKNVNNAGVWNRYQTVKGREKKFISYDEFKDMLFNIQMDDILNADYYVGLMQAIYEGIYSDDMSVLSNLRGKDIHDNIVIVRPDGEEPFELEVSNELAERLHDLARIHTLDRKNRHGMFRISIDGKHLDSCFKTENRNPAISVMDRDYKFSYYYFIRKTVEAAELGYSLRPKNLYISGIMHRIKERLEANGMTLEEVFAFKRKFGDDISIVKEELKRVCYPYRYREFTKLVSGYIEDF